MGVSEARLVAALRTAHALQPTALMKRRRILVLGAASVLGAHLAERLLADGHEVIAVDDFTSGSFATIAHLKRERHFAFVEHDIVTKFDANVDRVFHLALPSSERSYALDPARAALIGVLGTANVLEVAARGRARVVMATSVERHGDGARCAERLARDAMNARTLDVRFARVGTVYGPRMPLDDAHVVPRMIVQALRGENLVVAHDEAERVERLSYVDDAVEALLQAMDDERPTADVVAPFVERTVDEIASAILDVVISGAPQSTDPLEGGIARALRSMEDRIASVHPPESGFFDRAGRTSNTTAALLGARTPW